MTIKPPSMASHDGLRYLMALASIEGVGPVRSRLLIDNLGSAEAVFKERPHILRSIPGVGDVLADAVSKAEVLQAIDDELLWMEANEVDAIEYRSEAYPSRLRQCHDAPIVIYTKGNLELNPQRIIGIVGTRRCSAYGRQMASKLVEDLKDAQVTVVSGLASGIDGVAHRSSVEQGVPTIAVLGHGLDRIYPTENRNVAFNMLENGGWVSDFMSGTNPDRENFPKRNRIVAGMVDALIVVESQVQGGSMITADLAFGYNRDVLAFPGKATDVFSSGTNVLIKRNKASMITEASDLIKQMGWDINPKQPVQTNLFNDLSPEEQKLVELFRSRDQLSLDDLVHLTDLKTGELNVALLSLEMSGVLRSLPGNAYALL